LLDRRVFRVPPVRRVTLGQRVHRVQQALAQPELPVCAVRRVLAEAREPPVQVQRAPRVRKVPRATPAVLERQAQEAPAL